MSHDDTFSDRANDQDRFDHDTIVRLEIDGKPVDMPLKKTGVTSIADLRDIQAVDPVLAPISPYTTLGMVRTIELAGRWSLVHTNPDIQRLWSMVFGAPIPDSVVDMSIAQLHIAGLIVCCRIAQKKGKTPFLKSPESYLTPDEAKRLARMLDALTA